ncbi:MAG: short chain dehydrogenase [Saprospiraceae bacterium]|nr:MAG: short chain dehydrogenase [Saprospiraceae bacterium]
MGKIILIGASGTIGRYVEERLRKRHEVLRAGRKGPDLAVDISEPSSIEAMYREAGPVDAVVCIAGEARWAPLEKLSEEDYYVGIRSKLMGQVNLVRLGLDHLNPGGSFTLTTGILAEDPVPQTTSAAMVNGALHGFVKAAALEMKRGHRINAVAAGLVEPAAEKYADYFPGHNPVPMVRVVNGYVRSVECRGNGEIIRVYW